MTRVYVSKKDYFRIENLRSYLPTFSFWSCGEFFLLFICWCWFWFCWFLRCRCFLWFPGLWIDRYWRVSCCVRFELWWGVIFACFYGKKKNKVFLITLTVY